MNTLVPFLLRRTSNLCIHSFLSWLQRQNVSQFFIYSFSFSCWAHFRNFRKPILPALSTCVWSFLFLLSVSSQYVSFAACPFLATKFKNSSFLGRLADLGDYFKGFNELSVDFFFNVWEKTDVCQKPKAAYILSGLFNIKGWPLTTFK